MEWQQILGFYQVARLGSFTRAAEATFRTQSALTQQVKALEEELGCKLLERLGKRRLRLTPAGERFFKFAQTVLESQQGLLADLKDLEGGSGGPLTLAAPFTTLYHLLPEVVAAYVRRFPAVQLTILDRPQRVVIDLVKAGEADFGLALESLVPPDLPMRRWREVHTVLLVPRDHPLTQGGRPTLEDMARYPMILPPRSPEYRARHRVEELFRRHHLNFQVVMESSNVELSSLYVARGLGISFATILTEVLEPVREGLEFISLDHYFPRDYIVVFMRGRQDLPRYKQGFLDMLLDKNS